MATEEELLINERLFGACNHPDYTLESERSWGRTYQHAVCVSCNARADLYGEFSGTTDPLMELKLLIPRHCRDMIAINKVLRHLEGDGWRWTVQRRDGAHQFSIAKGQMHIQGIAAADETSAARSALVRVATSLGKRD